jgi:hypothetical protein
MTEDRILPRPPPPSSSKRIPSGEADFWAGLFVDLTVRVEWLTQSLDAVPKEDASAAALVRMRSYERALKELEVALGRVHAHRKSAALKPLFSLDGPLAGLLSRLYGWTEEVGSDFERMAVAIRRRLPTSTVFSHKTVNGSYAQFERLFASVRAATVDARDARDASRRPGAEDTALWRAFDESIEELIWATEWVHMTLARRPGD